MSQDRTRRVVATVMWRRLDVPGLEHFRLWTSPEDQRLEGTILVWHDGTPLRVEYEIVCSPAWETTRVTIGVVNGETTRRLGLVAESRRWWVHRGELEAVRGAVDADIDISPATNILAIRRLALLDAAPGASVDVTTAWIRLPDVSVEPLTQRYTRVAARRFRYEAPSVPFATDLEVDDLGLVVRYPPLWERVV